MVRGKWVILSLAVLAALALVGTYGFAKNEAKAKIELPEAVAKAVAAAFPGAKIEEVKVEDEDGVKVFEVELELKQGDQEIEIEVASDGTIIEVETEIQMTDVPPAAAEAIKAAAEGGKVEEVKKVEARAEIKDNNIVPLNPVKVTYEAEIEKGDQEGEIEVEADGKVVEPLKMKAKEKDEQKDEQGGCEKK